MEAAAASREKKRKRKQCGTNRTPKDQHNDSRKTKWAAKVKEYKSRLAAATAVADAQAVTTLTSKLHRAQRHLSRALCGSVHKRPRASKAPAVVPTQRRRPDKHRSGDSGDDGDGDDGGVSDAGSEPSLTGVFQNGTLYLVNESEGVAYHCERDEDGNLVPAGVWDAANRTVSVRASATTTATTTATAATTGASTATVGKPGAGSSASKRGCPQPAPAGDVAGDSSPAPFTKYPFVVDSDDHCETPPIAYEHLAPVLNVLAQHLGKQPTQLQVYDPYFCAGGVRDRLAAVGFPNVCVITRKHMLACQHACRSGCVRLT